MHRSGGNAFINDKNSIADKNLESQCSICRASRQSHTNLIEEIKINSYVVGSMCGVKKYYTMN
jgi:hypothetical protein